MFPHECVGDGIGVDDGLTLDGFDFAQRTVVDCLSEPARIGNPRDILQNEELADDCFDTTGEMVGDGADEICRADLERNRECRSGRAYVFRRRFRR